MENPFVVSALARDRSLHSIAEFDAWFENCKTRHAFHVELIPFDGLEKWRFDPATGNLTHASGRFFSIEGVWVETNFGGGKQWSQPIIHQPEVGVLGFLAKRFGGVLHFLVQAKMEPGNIHTVQVGPTLQATRSNYTRVHGGSEPAYLRYFKGREGKRVWVDVLQSEQGARFLRKRNRNMIVELDATVEVPVQEDYFWLSLGQLHQLMQRANTVNMDARSVLSCIVYNPGRQQSCPAVAEGVNHDIFRSAVSGDDGAFTAGEIIAWVTEQKTRYDLVVERIPLKYAHEWVRTDSDIHHIRNEYFKIVAARVAADSREVPAWTQPLVQPLAPGIVAFVVKPIDGLLHVLMQAKVEPGNFDVVEMAPTVQCLTGSYRKVPHAHRPPFLDYVLQAPTDCVLYDTMQSEEGGRFYRESNRNMIVLADRNGPETIPDNYIWMTVGQVKHFIQYNNFVNVQARCLLACLGVG